MPKLGFFGWHDAGEAHFWLTLAGNERGSAASRTKHQGSLATPRHLLALQVCSLAARHEPSVRISTPYEELRPPWLL